MEYVVKSLYVAGLNKKIFNSGDVITESDFAHGAIDGLVRGKYLEAKSGSESPAGESGKTADQIAAEKLAYDSITKADIAVKLTEKGIEFDAKADKQTLYNLLNELV